MDCPHPLRAILLAFPVALFPSALLADITYLKSAEIQWSNFAAWLIAGALLMGAPALLWATIHMVRRRRTAFARRAAIHVLLLGIAWLAGLVNAFKHSGDGWSSVGSVGLILSILSSVAVLAAGWTAYAPIGGRARS